MSANIAGSLPDKPNRVDAVDIRCHPISVTAAADLHSALSPAARLVAQAYGVIAPYPAGVTRIVTVLSQAKVRLGSRVLAVQQIRQCNDELVGAGICLRDARECVRAAPLWALPLTRAAHAAHRLLPIMTAFRSVQRRLWYDDPDEREMLFRCYVVAGDFNRLEELVGAAPATDRWRLLAEPLATDILKALPKRYIENALSGCLRHVYDTAAPSAPVIEICERLSSEPHVHAPEIAFIRLLQGRFEEAEAVFEALPPTARVTKPATTGLAATRALIATLRTDHDAAQRYIDAALLAEKAGTRKRNVFPDLPAFALSLLSLARIDSPASHAQLDQLIHAANRLEIESSRELSFVVNAARAHCGQSVYFNTRYSPRFDVLMQGLLTCWVDDFDALRIEDWLVPMLEYRERAAANGFGWVVAECDAALRRYAETCEDEETIAELSDPQLLHAKLGTTTLAVPATPVAEWEQSLKALEQLAYQANRTSGGKRDANPAKKRLVWELDGEHDDVRPTPREQRQNKNGTWSKGRKIALKRLAAEAASMGFLLPQDREAAAEISAGYSWGGHPYYQLGENGLFALAGHPHVFNAAGEPVDIVRREPGLFIDEEADGSAIVTLEPHGWETDEYSVTSVSDRRYEVTRFTPDHQRLFEVIPPEGLVLPAGGKSRLLEAVSALASQVRVQSATTQGATTAAHIDADCEPWVRLEPVDAGLMAALVVEPIPGSDICFAPGEGGGIVFANRSGQSVQARRDLAAEHNAEARLLERCRWLASRPTEYEPMILSEPTQCLEFLEQLESAGARCKWPQGEPLRIVARKSTSSLALTVKSADEWMQASGKLVVDDQRVLDLKRLFALLEANPGSRFLELDNGEFLALTKAFRRQLDDFASLSAPSAGGAMRLHPLAALGLEELIEGAELNADDGWRELRNNLQAAQSFEPDLPSTLQAELRPYQLDGYRWLARLSRWGAGACLADDMGLGKTVQTLALLLDRAPDGPALVVAPTSVTANWIDEARRFAPTLNVKVYTGAAASRASLLDDPEPFDLYVTTYGVLQNDADRLATVEWHSAVLDEAQAIKNPATKRARAVRRLRSKFRLITTGTPIQNNLMDLYSLFSFVNPGLLGSQEHFRRNFGLPVERDGDIDAQTRLRRTIAPFILRRLKTEVLEDLPERTEITLHVEMSPEETALYEMLRQRALEELEAARALDQNVRDGARRVQVLAHLTRLRLACCNPRLVVDSDAGAPGSSKLATFANTLEELLQNRHKVLVFSQFVMHLKLLEEHLNKAGIAYQYLDGGTPAKARAERIAAFQAGRGDVFLISLKAGGIGLNLTAADYVIHMDPWWNPAAEDQASDRAHRIGQTRPVTIYRLVTQGTIEEQIVDLHHRKRDLADQLLAGADASGRLNSNELLDLLRQPLALPDGRAQIA